MNSQLLSTNLEQLKDLPADQPVGDHFHRFQTFLESYDKSVPSSVARVFQAFVDRFQQLPEMCRTDFLSCLVCCCKKLPKGRFKFNMRALAEALEQLEVWDLEIAIEALSYHADDDALQKLRTYSSHQEPFIQDAAKRAMRRRQMSRWFRRAG